VLDEREVAVHQVRDIGRVAGQEVVDTDHLVTTVEQRLREMGSDEAGRAGDDYALFVGH
jgi:hypothetical protein